MADEATNAPVLTRVWDYRPLPQEQRAAAFQECCERMDFHIGDPGSFNAWMEISALGGAGFSRRKCAPLTSMWKPEADEYLVYLNLAGGFIFNQGNREIMGRPGDLSVFHTGRPLKMNWGVDGPEACVYITIPRSAFGHIKNAEEKFQNTLLSRSSVFPILLQCFVWLAQRGTDVTAEEAEATLGACRALLPIAAGCYEESTRSSLQRERSFARIAQFVHEHIANSSLSATVVARELGMSDRSVHRLFALRGTTFNAYVKDERVRRVYAELMRDTRKDVSLTEMADAWGFSSLSSLSRAFQELYSVTPMQCRRLFTLR